MIKVIKYGFFVFLLIFLILLLTPWLFKNEIFEKVQKEANKMLMGELVIEDLSLSLIRDFPNLSLNLYNLKYTGDGEFKGEELFNISELSAELDLMSVIAGDKIDVKEIAIINPNIHVKVLENGSANYLIMKEDGTSESVEETSADEEPSPFNLGIQAFIIENLNFTYQDFESNISADLLHAHINLAGDFNEIDVAVKTTFSSEEFSVKMDDIAYISKVVLDAKIDANYNQENGKITLGGNTLAVNNLILNYNGWLQSFDEKVALDVTFSAPNGSFKEVLSLIPAFYLEGYEDIAATGTFDFSGYMKGDYFYDGDNLPEFDFKLIVDNGKIQYPDLPSSISNIAINTQISHAQGITDLVVVDVKKASLNMAGSPFSATLYMKNLLTDPDLDITLKTSLDLEKLTEVIPVEGQKFKGILMADAYVKGRLSNFEKEQYDRVDAGGWLRTKSLVINTSSLNSEVVFDTVNMTVTPQNFSLAPLKITLGESDFEGTGRLTNLLGYALKDDTLTGSFSLHSNRINATELMGMMVEDLPESTAETADEKSTQSAESVPVETVPMELPANLNLVMTANAKTVVYDDMELTNLSGKLILKNAVASLQGFKMDLLDGEVLMDGSFATPNKVPTVDMDLQLKNVAAKAAFTTFNTVQSFAPVAESASGNFTTKFSLKSTLDNEFSPDLKTIQAKGNLKTLGVVMQPEVMAKVASLLKNESLKKIRLDDADLSFEIKDGRVNVAPVDLKVGGQKATLSGSHGLDETMDYLITTEIPMKNVELPAAIKALNLVGETIPVKLNITGTFKDPKINPVFANSANAKDLVTDVVNKAIDMAKDSIDNTIDQQKIKLLAEAQKQADALLLEAKNQAISIKEEAAKQAVTLKAEARKKAAELVAEAKGDPLKEFGAKAAGELAIKEADKQIDKLNAEANKQADELLKSAETQAAKILEDAEKQANIK